MHRESLLNRYLWPLVLTAAVALVAVSFAQGPLSSSGGAASAQARTLTLWVAGGEAAGETETLARQLAACGGPRRQAASVGVLTGGSVQAIEQFLSDGHGLPGELLLLSSGQLSQVAYDARQPADSETGELGRTTAKALLRATPVALLADDPPALAVSSHAAIDTTGQLLALMRSRPAQPALAIASEAWLVGGLAALAQSAGVQGAMPFQALGSSRQAAVSLQEGKAQAVLAPHSALARQLRAGRLRQLAWPAWLSAAPQGWIAVLAPAGLGTGALAGLRSQAQGLCGAGAWRRQLASDGLAPAHAGKATLARLIDTGLDEAQRLQALAAATVRDY